MRLIFILLCSYICLFVQAQTGDAVLRTYTTREGLSNNYVQCITKDSRGFLWVGTKEGLCRFNGHDFKKIFGQQSSVNNLSGNFIFNILEYKTGHLVIATNSGLCVLNTLTGQFENERIDFAPLKAGSGINIINVLKTPDGQILVNHNGEFDLLDSNLKYQYRLSDTPWARGLKGCLIYERGQVDKQQRLWLGSDTTGIQIIDFSAKQVWNYKNNPQHLTFLEYRYSFIRSFFLDEANNILWFCPWGYGLVRHDLKTHKEQRQAFGANEYGELASVNAIIPRDDHRLFCAIDDKLFEMDIHSLAYKAVLDKKIVGILANTGHNQFWAGTAQGLVQISNASSPFKELLLEGAGNFTAGECTGLANVQNGNIYATYRNNTLFEIQKDRIHYTSFKIQGKDKIIMSEVCEDKQGGLWIGTSDGLFFFDRVAKKFSQPVFLPEELRHIVINVLFCDHSGDLWIGTRAPFFLYRVDNGHHYFEKITNDVIDKFTGLYYDSRISRITEDKKNNLWMTSFLGGRIINFNKSTRQWKFYPVSKQLISTMGQTGIANLYPDENNNLWIAKDDGSGLLEYNYLTDGLKTFTISDGLVSNFIINMAADQSNNLWLSTEYGITQFNIQDYKVVSYNIENSPLAKLEYVENIFDTVSKHLLYAMNERWLFVDMDHLPGDSAQVIPIVDRVMVNNKELFIDARIEEPKLKYRENNVSIEFTGIDFSTVHSLNFAYQLSGLDIGWRFSDASRSALYANLPPGKYVFKIKTANENGKWSPVYEAFRFEIRPVFWQTTWFLVLVFCFVSFLIFWLVRRRIRIIRKEAGLKHKIAEAEMMALRSQMNPHFIFNCLNAIDNLIQTNQADKATTYLARFAKLIRSFLESSKNNMVPFHKDFESLRLFLELEQFRSNNKFVYEIKADKELMEGDYKVPPLIIQPFVENAIHHGLLNKGSGERKLLVNALIENNIIKYIIEDNGVGRIKAQELKEMNRPEHQSYGIQISSERIHLHNQNGKMDDVIITDLMEEGHPAGTMVKIKLKIL